MPKKVQPNNEPKPSIDEESIVMGRINIKDLVLDDENANMGTDRGMSVLDTSIEEFGVGRGIVIDRNGKIIGGNKTVTKLKEVDGVEVVVVKTRGNTLVVNQREDLDLDDPELRTRSRGLAIADNRTAELNLNWDLDNLLVAATEYGVSLDPFFNESEQGDILAILEKDLEKQNREEQEREEEFKKQEPPKDAYMCPHCKKGIGEYLWKLGLIASIDGEEEDDFEGDNIEGEIVGDLEEIDEED